MGSEMCIRDRSKTGHSPIKEKMKELNSPLSGEMSGHICYADDFFGYDDALYVALRLLRILGIIPPFMNLDVNVIDDVIEKVENDILPLVEPTLKKGLQYIPGR